MRALNVCLAGLGAFAGVVWEVQQNYRRIKAPDVALTTIFGIATNIFEGCAHTSRLGRRSLQAVNLTLGITSAYLAWQSFDIFNRPFVPSYPNHEVANEGMRILNITHLALTAADCFYNAFTIQKDLKDGNPSLL